MGSSHPTVTIGLPFYNNETTLELAIRSALVQSFTDWELILVDDGSSDRSVEIARAVEDPRVRVLADGRNLGLAARLNEITAAARGEYIARMDADDVMHPERLHRQVAAFEAEPALDLLGTAAYIIDEGGAVAGLAGAALYDDRPRAFLTNHTFIHPTVMARTAWMARHPYDPHFRRGQDKELWCRTQSSSKFGKLPEPLLFFRDFKTFSFHTYRLTRRFDREIISRYGPSILGARRAWAMAEKTRAKVALYAVMHPLRLESLLVRRRYHLMNPSERLRAQEILDRLGDAESTHVQTAGARSRIRS